MYTDPHDWWISCTNNTSNYHIFCLKLPSMTSQVPYQPRNRDRGLNSANLPFRPDPLSSSFPFFLLELQFHLPSNQFPFSFQFSTPLNHNGKSAQRQTPNSSIGHPTIKPACPHPPSASHISSNISSKLFNQILTYD